MDIKRLVNSLVRKYKTRDPFEIIENLNAIVVFHPLQGVRGFRHGIHLRLLKISMPLLSFTRYKV